MGVCLSRCGDAQHKAGVVAATISHQNSLETCHTDVADPNHSLKTFLHLYESKRSFSSPRGSDALHIPHSSELFSLPDSDASPARTSRASISSSPKSTRHSFSVWGGRFSTESKTISIGCRKKPRRSIGDHDHHHQRLVEAIARLERLNNGKNLELRGSSFCRADLESRPRHLLTKSRSGEIRRPHRVGVFAAQEDLESAFSQPKTMGNLVSMAAPIIKQRPLEKSVTKFLKEVETFVSLIEAPRLSLSSEAALRESLKEDPVIITTYEREDTDSDEQFTFFEASFEGLDCCRKSQEPELRKSVEKPIIVSSPVEKATLSIYDDPGIEKSVCGEELVSDSATMMVEKPIIVASSPVEKATLSIYEDPGIEMGPNFISPESVKNTVCVDLVTLSIYEDPGIETRRIGKPDQAVRVVLVDVDTNVAVTMPIPKKSPSVKKSSPSRLKSAPRGLRRGLSRSLDSRDQCSSKAVDFTVFRSTAQVAPLLPSPAQEEGLIEANNTEMGVVQDSEGKLEQPASEEGEFCID